MFSDEISWSTSANCASTRRTFTPTEKITWQNGERLHSLIPRQEATASTVECLPPLFYTVINTHQLTNSDSVQSTSQTDATLHDQLCRQIQNTVIWLVVQQSTSFLSSNGTDNGQDSPQCSSPESKHTAAITLACDYALSNHLPEFRHFQLRVAVLVITAEYVSAA